MNTKSSWEAECKRYFIETDELNKKGNPKTMAVDVRKLHISGSFIFTELYQVTLVRRKSGNLYSVKQKVKVPQAWWDKTPAEFKWEKEGTYSREAFLAWLKPRIDNPLAAVVDLETCPPDNLDKAA